MTKRQWAVLVPTMFGLGKSRWAPGTVGSLVGVVAGMATIRWFPWPVERLVAFLAADFVICAILCTAAERHLGHDAPAIILDEVWAMAAILVLLPWTTQSSGWLLAAFLLFRAFDVVKPFPLKRLAKLPRGWGIMADDLGAAAYTIALLWVIRPR